MLKFQEKKDQMETRAPRDKEVILDIQEELENQDPKEIKVHMVRKVTEDQRDQEDHKA